jgi:hypothetical protein
VTNTDYRQAQGQRNDNADYNSNSSTNISMGDENSNGKES